jgi:O-acetylhomoserine/O-acetylserine sulfhydrylase
VLRILYSRRIPIPRCDMRISTVTFKKFGIGVKFVTDDKPESFAAAIDEKTKAIFVESIGNPKYNVSPLPELAKVSIP